MPAKLKELLPFLGLVLAVVLSYLTTALTDNRVNTEELLNLGIVLTNALTVYILPRLEGVLWLKPATAVTLALLQALTSYLTDGISASEWPLLGLAALGALGVVVTNKQVPLTRSNTTLAA